MATQDQPLIAWRSLLTGASYTVTAGTDNPDAPFSRAFGTDMLMPAIPQTDANGTLTVAITPDPARYQIGYGTTPYGATPYGGWLPQALIIGAHRHDSAGFHDLTGATISLDNGLLAPSAIGEPGNASRVWTLAPISTMPATITLTITGLPASSYVRIPHIYIGQALRMPYLELGYDPYPEHTQAAEFRSASGRIYRQIRYRQLKLAARWRHIADPAITSEVALMIEDALELHEPVWWAWSPDSLPHECYLVDAVDVPRFPVALPGMIRDLTMRMDEVL